MKMKNRTLIIKGLEDQIVPMLQNCKGVAQLKQIHAHILKYSLSQSNFLMTKIIDICDISGRADYASLIFKQANTPNVFLYNAMIRACSHNCQYSPAISIYRQMLTNPQTENPILPDKFTFPFVLKSCAGLLNLKLGKQIHSHVCKYGPEFNINIGNSLVDMYLKCNNLTSARQVFDEMPERDPITSNTLISGYTRTGEINKARQIFDEMPDKTIVSWTALIAGYTRSGRYLDAINIFRQMQLTQLKPDEISIITVLPACAQLGALELGKWIHVFSDKNRLLCKTSICNALIEMYAKCGSIDLAWQLFDKMPDRDVISWTTMIAGFANHGRPQEAIELFTEMEVAGVEPNSITFLSILCACAHAGFLAEGLQYFESMTRDYHIIPTVEHHGCVVDLLGRLGLLDQALGFIKNMPIEPDAAIWGSLLSACRTHGNAKLAITAMEHLIELEPDDTGNYVLLSNIYAASGRWDDVSRTRKLVRSKRMKKTPGCSSIEVNNLVQEFIAGDPLHQISNEIYAILDLLAIELQKGLYMEFVTEGIENVLS